MVTCFQFQRKSDCEEDVSTMNVETFLRCWSILPFENFFCAMESLVENKVNSKSVLCKYCQSLLYSLVYFKYNLGKYQGKVMMMY